MNEDTLNSINVIMTSAYLALTCLMVTFVFISVCMRLDRSMIFISLVYPVSYLLRMPLSFLNQGGKG